MLRPIEHIATSPYSTRTQRAHRASITKLPPKAPSRTTAPRVARRRIAHEDWLAVVLLYPDLRACEALCRWLPRPPTVDPSKVRAPQSAVAALAHALRAFAPLRTLVLVKACTAPAGAVASAAALLRHTAAGGTYARIRGGDVFASERGRGLFGGVRIEVSDAAAEFAEGAEDAGTAEDEDEPLQLVPPGGADSAPRLVRPYGFVHEHMWRPSSGAAPCALAVETCVFDARAGGFLKSGGVVLVVASESHRMKVHVSVDTRAQTQENAHAHVDSEKNARVKAPLDEELAVFIPADRGQPLPEGARRWWERWFEARPREERRNRGETLRARKPLGPRGNQRAQDDGTAAAVWRLELRGQKCGVRRGVGTRRLSSGRAGETQIPAKDHQRCACNGGGARRARVWRRMKGEMEQRSGFGGAANDVGSVHKKDRLETLIAAKALQEENARVNYVPRHIDT
ncbi:hypothetical protein FB451DRAFT_1186904 [Mycena latifolia]|nr:hypothetical protein FB451DRAFT_1186904 [Mycena latifolia]